MSDVTTGSWRGVLHPPQVAAILNQLIGEAPFANSLTRFPTGAARSLSPRPSPTARPG